MALEITSPFMWGAGGAKMSPEEIARQRQVEDALLARGVDTSPVGHWTQGLARVADALAGSFRRGRLDTAAQENADFNSQVAQGLLGGQQFPAAPSVSDAASPVAAADPVDIPSQRVAQAFAASAPDGVSAAAPADTGWLQYANTDAIRNQPLDPKLTNALGFLPDMGVTMKVFSGGQDATGPRRTGSHRHDHGDAADVFFYKDGRQLDWNNPQDVPIYQQIVERAKANGVTGFGAGEGYMRPGSMHIGFGAPAVWGAGGRGTNAPDWLRQAFNTPETASPAVAATNAMAAPSPAAPPLPAPVNVPDMPVAGQPASPQPVQVAQAANTGTPGQMSDADALTALGASAYKPGDINPAIVQALSDPRVNDTTRQIATLLLKQQMAARQPKDLMSVGPGTTIFDPNSGKQVFSAPFKPDTLSPDALAQQLQLREAGKPSTVINNNPESSMFAGLPKDVRDEMFKRQATAQDAADLINVTNQGLQLLDQGAITGAGSGAKIAAVKWAQTLGIPVSGDVASVVNNTEAYRSIMAKAVGKVIKNFGSGTGLSDADRQYAERLAGGDTNLNEPAIRRILAAGVKQSQQQISGYTAMRDKVMKGDLGAMLNVNEPPAYTPPPSSGTTSGGLKWSIEP